MEYKLPFEYGPREAYALQSALEEKRIPNKNEGLRRGVLALHYLTRVDERVLLGVLGDLLSQCADQIEQHHKFSTSLDSFAAARALAYVVVAAHASQKGALAAESIDTFRASLDDIYARVDQELTGPEAKAISRRLLGLSEFSRALAKSNQGRTERDVSLKPLFG